MDIAALLPQFTSALAFQPQLSHECKADVAALEAQQQHVDLAQTTITAEYEGRIAELLKSHQAELESLRVQWCEEQSALVATRVTAQIAEAADDIAYCVARILNPFVATVLRKAAVADFCNKIRQAASANMQAAIVLEGPADLIEACQQVLSGSGIAPLTRNSTADMQAIIGKERLQSNIKSWLDKLTDEADG